MAKFRFVGHLEFLGRTIPLDLWFDCSTVDLTDALAGLVCYPDDPFWEEPPARRPASLAESESDPPLPEKIEEGLPSPAVERRPAIASPHLFDDLFPGDDERNWLIIADRFPDLFKEESGPVPGLAAPPKNQADIRRLRRQQGEQPEEGSKFEADLVSLLASPRAELLKADGAINASTVARLIGRRTGGTDWSYVQEVVAHLQASYDEQDLAADVSAEDEQAA